ncbi:MAG: hypothetical protein V7L22_17330 [Nostoc sp.]|uniref:hypothetical protein n=1 Tax=Nostoc sp. TaxID=1180 RepID=UPI002FF6E485
MGIFGVICLAFNEDIALMYKICDACGVLVAIAPTLSCQIVGAIALHKEDYLASTDNLGGPHHVNK